jgi:hypothetical protein
MKRLARRATLFGLTVAAVFIAPFRVHRDAWQAARDPSAHSRYPGK